MRIFRIKVRAYCFFATLLLCLFLFNNALAATAKLNGLRVSSTAQKTRLVFDLSQSVSFHVFALSNPNRVVVDIRNTQLVTHLNKSRFTNSPISAIRTGHHGRGNLRVVLDLKKEMQYKAFLLSPHGKLGYRLVVDLTSAKQQKPFKKQPQTAVINSTVKTAEKKTITATRLYAAARAEVKTQKQPNTSTVTSKASAKSKPVPGKKKSVNKVLVAKAEKQKTLKQITAEIENEVKVERVAKQNANKKPEPKVTVEPATKLRKIVVVIDPGHGGKDSGAVGPRGTHEKKVVLAIAKDLRQDLNREPGFKAYLTRKGNYYISLRKRLAIARKDKADMFISVHADAFKNRRANGASVYALSQRGATSEAARWLANRENRSEMLGGAKLVDMDRTLRSVLIDLSQTATINASLQIGTSILHQLGRIARLHHNKVEQAAFVVLKSPDIPSVLIETGFISNPGEEHKLRSSKYQKKIARAIMQGVKSYFIQHPPKGTILASQHKRVRAGKHIVTSGESLYSVAKRYRVSVSRLRRVNKIPRGGKVKAGEVLVIPQRRG